MLNTINYILWMNICIILLVFSIKLTIQSNFIQFRFIKIIQSIFKNKKDKNEITNFQILMMSLGGKIGVGSISGIALAIYYGGIGTIFWMLIITLVISVFSFYEVYLGNFFKEIDTNKIYKGGPSYYIKKGLNKKKLSFFYTILIVICYNGLFLSIQSNTIMKMTNYYYHVNPFFIGICICLLTILMIYKGVKQIAKISNILVPIMIAIYLLLAMFIMYNNLSEITNIFQYIINDAFKIKPFLTSFIPMLILTTQRTIFATESSLGTSAIAASTSSSSPTIQGYIQLLGIYITVFIICLSTTIIIVTTNYQVLNLNNINGIELVIYSFNYHFGKFGNTILYVIVLMFCFSTIITGYYNGESSIKSLNIKKILFLKVITLIALFIGVIIQASLLWSITDLLIGFILIINVYSVYKLRNTVKE